MSVWRFSNFDTYEYKTIYRSMKPQHRINFILNVYLTSAFPFVINIIISYAIDVKYYKLK